MRLMVQWIVLLAVAGVVPASFAREEGEAPPAPERDNKLRVLVVTGGHDFQHKEFFELFAGHPDMTSKEVVQPEAQQWFAPEKASEYDVMVWYDLYSKISDKSRQDLVALLNKGKPLVVLHHAMGDYQDWPEAMKIIGGRFYITKERTSGFKHDEKLNVKIVDPNHPITRFMKDFQIEDETYKDCGMLPGVKPLLTTDNPTSDKVIAWTHRYGKSPVAFIQLGHDAKAYGNPSYRRLVAQAIRWVAGRLPDPSEKGFVKLFNGKDLDGWIVVGKPAGFEVKDGILHSDAGKDGQWLRSNKEYDYFELRLEWRVSKDANAGVFIRAGKEGYPWETGSEVQISNEPRNAQHCTGSLYGLVTVAPRPDESPDVWHEFVIRCVGPRITIWSDNIPVIDVDSRKVPAMKDKPGKGYVGLQDSHNSAGWIEYRNIRIKEIRHLSGFPIQELKPEASE